MARVGRTAPGSNRPSGPPSSKGGKAKEQLEHRKRVGEFVRQRREALGLTQGDVIAALRYVSRNSVSNVETGREGLPARRVFDWADILQVPHDAFFRFVTGESKRMEELPEPDVTEAGLVQLLRKLPERDKRKVRDFIDSLLAQKRLP